MTVEYQLIKPEELSNLSDAFSAIFQSDGFERDYENKWEWLEGYSKPFHSLINIRREHNWNTGEYDQPIEIKLVYTNFLPQSILDEIGQKIATTFQTTVHFRALDRPPTIELAYKNEKQYKPAQ